MSNIGTKISKCTNCGADMHFNPKKGLLVCPFCDSTQKVVFVAPKYRDYLKFVNDGGVYKGKSTYHCPNCDGLVEVEGFNTSIKCNFCGATNVIDVAEQPGIKPDSVLPFLLGKEDAVEYAHKWLKKKLFAPRKAKKLFSPSEMKGLYVPSFIFNSISNSTYEGRFGEEYKVQVKRGDHMVTETRVRWYHVSGKFTKSFEGITIEACTRVQQKDIDKIVPFDIENITTYDRSYLAGFECERYSTPINESFDVAKGIMDKQIRKAIISQYNPDKVDYLNVSTVYNNTNFQYALLPIWQSEYTYREKKYNFVVNGRTGKSTGKAPISPLRVLIAIIFILCIVAAILTPIILNNIS